MTDAYDSDMNPDDPDSPFLLEPYAYTDYPARVVRRAQAKNEKKDEHANDDLVWGVKKIPRVRLQY